MITSVVKGKKHWSDQRTKLIDFQRNFALKIHKNKIGRFLAIAFGEVCPKISNEIDRLFREFVPKNPAKFDLFLPDLSEALTRREILYLQAAM